MGNVLGAIVNPVGSLLGMWSNSSGPASTGAMVPSPQNAPQTPTQAAASSDAQNALLDMTKTLFGEAQPVTQQLLSQGLEALKTGGIGAQIPLINQIVNATQAATQQRVSALQSATAGYGAGATAATGKAQSAIEQAGSLYTGALGQASNLATSAIGTATSNYIQSLVDAANRGVEASKSATSQTMVDVAARLGQVGQYRSPLGQNVLAQTELAGNQNVANIMAQLEMQKAGLAGPAAIQTAQIQGQTALQTAMTQGQVGLQTAQLSGQLDTYLAQLQGELGITTADITSQANLGLAQLPGQLAMGFVNQLPAFVGNQTQVSVGGVAPAVAATASMYGANAASYATQFASANDAYSNILGSLIKGVTGIGAAAAGA